jgi:hypothetical protein
MRARPRVSLWLRLTTRNELEAVVRLAHQTLSGHPKPAIGGHLLGVQEWPHWGVRRGTNVPEVYLHLGGRAKPANEGRVKTGQRGMHSGH